MIGMMKLSYNYLTIILQLFCSDIENYSKIIWELSIIIYLNI